MKYFETSLHTRNQCHTRWSLARSTRIKDGGLNIYNLVVFTLFAFDRDNKQIEFKGYCKLYKFSRDTIMT